MVVMPKYKKFKVVLEDQKKKKKACYISGLF